MKKATEVIGEMLMERIEMQESIQEHRNAVTAYASGMTAVRGRLEQLRASVYEVPRLNQEQRQNLLNLIEAATDSTIKIEERALGYLK